MSWIILCRLWPPSHLFLFRSEYVTTMRFHEHYLRVIRKSQRRGQQSRDCQWFAPKTIEIIQCGILSNFMECHLLTNQIAGKTRKNQHCVAKSFGCGSRIWKNESVYQRNRCINSHTKWMKLGWSEASELPWCAIWSQIKSTNSPSFFAAKRISRFFPWHLPELLPGSDRWRNFRVWSGLVTTAELRSVEDECRNAANNWATITWVKIRIVPRSSGAPGGLYKVFESKCYQMWFCDTSKISFVTMFGISAGPM